MAPPLLNAWDREIWARTLWMETRGETDEGRRAVAHVIWNRHQRPGNKLRIAGVCMADQQFSCWNASRTDNNREALNAIARDDDPLLEEFRRLVDQVATGDPDPVQGANLYYSTIMPAPPPWVSNPERPVAFVVQIGLHRFYRE